MPMNLINLVSFRTEKQMLYKTSLIAMKNGFFFDKIYHTNSLQA